LKNVAKTQRKTQSDLVGSIDTTRERGNLSLALRLFVLNHYQAEHEQRELGWLFLPQAAPVSFV
jgi:predicted DNA-binding ribbon-helix-helix protein